MQNENGPCPLLAAANALLLRGEITLPPQTVRSNVASIDNVVNMLAERALKSSEQSQLETKSQSKPNSTSAYHVDELLTLFPSLQYGMDVNPKFTLGPKGCEYTKGVSAFDMMGVELVHGWLVDVQDEVLGSIIGNKSYNELTEIMIMGNEASTDIVDIEGKIRELKGLVQSMCEAQEKEMGEEKEKEMREDHDKGEDQAQEGNGGGEGEGEGEGKGDGDGDGEQQNGTYPTAEEVSETINCTHTDKNTDEERDGEEQLLVDAIHNSELDNGSSVESESMQVQVVQAQQEKIEKLQEMLELKNTIFREGQTVTEFLSATSTQLTYSGLTELHNYVQEGALCVFFRNNHFATLTKHCGILYLLITDLGYQNVPEVMWEKLDDISGDTEYADQDFVKTKPRADLASAGGLLPSLSPEQMLAQSSINETDFQLALQLSRNETHTQTALQEQEGKLMAAAREASLQAYEHDKDSVCNNAGAAGANTNSNTNTNAANVAASFTAAREEQDKIIAMQLQKQFEEDNAREHQRHSNSSGNNSNNGYDCFRSSSRTKKKSDNKDKGGCIIS